MSALIRRRLAPTFPDAGLSIPGHYVWGSSVIRAEGKWHIFSSAWPERAEPQRYDEIELLQNYWRLSTIVRGEADRPEGPYTYRELVLTGQGGDHWAHECCHNPCLVRVGDRYVLYFQTKGRAERDRRIGYATAPSVHGPWTLADGPLPLGENVTNPAPCVESGGRIRLAFRRQGMRLEVAEADAFDGAYEIVQDDLSPGVSLEDPFLYRLGGRWHMLVEDNRGGLTGRVRHGAHLVSDDGVHFELFHEEPEAYTHTVAWTDGTKTTFDRRERPALIRADDGRPTHLVTGVLLGRHARSLIQPLV